MSAVPHSWSSSEDVLAGAGDVYMRLRELLADEAQTRGLSEQDRQEMAKVVFMLLRSELDR